MIVNLPHLVLALVILWLPRSWLRQGPVLWRSRRARSSTHSWTHAPADGTTLTPRQEFLKVRNYVDLLRATAATMALMGSNNFAPALAPAATAASGLPVLALKLAILLLGVLIQTVRLNRGRLTLAAPIFYVGGIAIGLEAPLAGVGAFAIAWALVPVIPFAQGFLIVLAAVFGAINFVLGGISLPVLGASAIFFVPVLLSLLSGRPLLVYSRRGGNR